MKLKILKPGQALRDAHLKASVGGNEIENFKINLIKLLDNIDEIEREENQKTHVRDFLRDTYYKDLYEINTKDTKDLVVHLGKTNKSPVGVIIEAKRPTNKGEMLSKDNINVKAFQELILYFLRERIKLKNLRIKYLIATNIYEWFIFEVDIFEKYFAKQNGLVKQFEDFENKQLSGKDTKFFYDEIAKPFINELDEEITFTYFDIRDYEEPLRNKDKEDDKKLINLFKLLSPQHLLKLDFANDSNNLNKHFYGELLHIIGLIETKKGSKKLIDRNDKEERNTGSLLENAIIQLNSLDKISRLDNPSHFGKTKEDRLFNVGLELIITWINRILFLKLLEAQIVTYHKDDKSYEFLNIDRIKNYDDLNSLFFQVLAIKQSERNEDVKKLFEKVPYLNSSLFEPSEIEQSTIFISNLRDEKTIPIFTSTVLKNKKGKKRTGELLNTLEYLFEFLDAYNFSSNDSKIIQEDSKTLINASVLGLIFEKINGYKDGSFFTPGFITMYMSKETIRKAVVQKFNETKNWNCKNINDIYDKIEVKDRQDANNIINDLKICDPAVGSGHFLVSALNEIISIKSDLNILQDREGKRLKEYKIKVIDDELLITDEDNELFEYNPKSITGESQRIQETIFHEKQTIIENCLFGVDINPNSVKICRLRLWIELLKNTYYKNETELETLPNIDINIKCGNSLISRFDLDVNLGKALKKSKWSIESYRIAIDTYRNAQNKEQKHEMEKLINDIKSDFRSEISSKDPKLRRLNKIKGEIFGMTHQTQMFEMTKNEKTVWKKKIKKLTEESNKLETKINEIKNNKIYKDAFEWRFEFPEVLDNNGDFIGFDVVIGNPPYVRADAPGNDPIIRDYLVSSDKFKTLSGKWDLYIPFVELSHLISMQNGVISLIVPDAYCHASYASPSLDFYTKNNSLEGIDYFPNIPIFQNVGVYSVIVNYRKNHNNFNYIRREHNEANELREHIQKDYPSSFRVDFRNSIINSKNNLVDIEDVCYISKGIVGNSDEKIFKGEFKIGDLVSNIQDEIHSRLYYEGKNISKWILDKQRYIEYNTKRSPSKWSRKGFPEFFDSTKIVTMRSPGLNPRSFIDYKKGFFNESAIGFVRWCDLKKVNNKSINKQFQDNEDRVLKENISSLFSLNYISALFNSKLIRYELNSNRRSNIHIYPDDWRKLLLPKPSSLIAKELEHMSELITSQTLELSKTISFIIKNIITKFSIEKISRKLQNWNELEFGEFVKELNKAIKKEKGIQLSEKDESGWFELFENYKNNSEELKYKIDQKNKEIDQLIYNLYGLTEEEIKIVENS